MTSSKILWGVLCLLLLASDFWSMSRWSESRGVFDDVCYLRQAHLFQRFGFGGLDTDISRDDDHYLQSKLQAIGFPGGGAASPPCHTPMPASGKRVLQYPPGTGFLLALFPGGHQVVPLYMATTLLVFGVALLGIVSARSAASIALAGAFGCLAIYLMINPSKASYSMAPTMAVCALAGYLTARLFTDDQQRLWSTALLGLVLGLAVNFRLPNLFLASGYVVPFLLPLRLSRHIRAILPGAAFAIAYLAGITPTLVANAINAGSPFATTYGGQDVAPPGFSLDVIRQYLADLQFVLLAVAILGTAIMLRTRRDRGVRLVALLVAANLTVNLAFFLSHPVFTPYYTIPIAALSLWSLLFASLLRPAEAVDGKLMAEAATERS